MKTEIKESTKKWVQGYMCCLATIIRMAGENTEHQEAFYACCKDIQDCIDHGVDEYDLEELRKHYP